MRELLATTRREEGLMIALGLTGAALVTAGTALLVRGSDCSVDEPDSGSTCGTIASASRSRGHSDHDHAAAYIIVLLA
jgi:hypothetical protein